MPIIHVHLLEGRSSDIKRKLISEITESVSRTLGNPKETIRVLLHEVSDENWGVGGVPINEKRTN